MRMKIKKDLIEQLNKREIKNPYILSMVEDYMSLWDTKELLIQDIQKRGVNVPWQNSPKQKGFRKNDSVAELVKVNAQMLKILSELGLRGADIKADEPDVSL